MAESTELLMILHDEREVEENKDEVINEITEIGSEQEAEATQDDDTPEKYRGKSSSDLIRMHQEAEKHMGRQSQEVGSLRKEFDTYVQAQLATPAAEEAEDEVDFFADPEAAMKRAIDKHPDLVKARQTTVNNTREKARNNLKATHTDMDAILADEAFGSWVMDSPIRKKLYAQADQQFDYDAANELLSNWKERKSAVEQTNKAEKSGRKQALKSASTGTAQGSGEAASKKVYRRSDIIKLMQTDPDRYQSLSGEIMKAYAEGRVR